MNQVFETRAGEIKDINQKLEEASKSADVDSLKTKIDQLTTEKDLKIKNLCSLDELSYVAPKNVQKILAAKNKNLSDLTLSNMIFAVKTYLTDDESFDKNIADCMANFDSSRINDEEIKTRAESLNGKNIFLILGKKEKIAAIIIANKAPNKKPKPARPRV